MGMTAPDMSIFVTCRSGYLVFEIKAGLGITLGYRMTFKEVGRKRMGRQQSTRVDAPEGWGTDACNMSDP